MFSGGKGGMFSVGKGGRCEGLTTLPTSCADCLEIWEPQPPGTLRACHGIALPLYIWAVCFSHHPVEIPVHKASDTGEISPHKQWVQAYNKKQQDALFIFNLFQ
jgi:hypothetical protein